MVFNMEKFIYNKSNYSTLKIIKLNEWVTVISANQFIGHPFRTYIKNSTYYSNDPIVKNMLNQKYHIVLKYYKFFSNYYGHLKPMIFLNQFLISLSIDGSFKNKFMKGKKISLFDFNQPIAVHSFPNSIEKLEIIDFLHFICHQLSFICFSFWKHQYNSINSSTFTINRFQLIKHSNKLPVTPIISNEFKILSNPIDTSQAPINISNLKTNHQ